MISNPHLRPTRSQRLRVKILHTFIWTILWLRAITWRTVYKGLRCHIAELLAGISYAGLVVWCYSAFEAPDAHHRILMISGIYLLVAAFWASSLADSKRKAIAWGYVAEETELTCTVGTIFTGWHVEANGTYRGRALHLGTEHHGVSQLQSTVITVEAKLPDNVTLNIRGPFSAKEIEQDQVSQNLFEAVNARQVGRNGRFYVRGKPYGMVHNLYRKTEAWDSLEQLPAPITIEIENGKLKLQQMIQLLNPDDLMRSFEVISDFADALEE